MQALKRCWFPLLPERDLRVRPMAIRLLGVPLVLFRGANGVPAVLEDRCPHRLVPLSLGNVERGVLRCAYHGWTFNSQGTCTDVPSLPRNRRVPKACVPGYRVQVKHGTIWATLSDQPYDTEPRGWLDGDEDASLHTVDIACDYVRILENLVDNAHAAFVHRGYLRSYPNHSVRAVLEETATGLRVETHGEKARRSILFSMWRRIAATHDFDVLHVEEYLEPSGARVEYMDRARRLRIAVQFMCVPQDDYATRLMYRCLVRTPMMSGPLRRVLALNVGRLMAQDRVLLEAEAAAARSDGQAKPRVLTSSDAPGVWVARAAREYAASGPKPRSKLTTREVEYLL